MAFRLGVDVGGTFTDLFLVGDNCAGTQYRVKTPSTPADPSEGVLAGVRRICEESGVAVGDLRNILHGTTVATNAVLESKGARVGLITTQGFAQILHLARSQTPGPLAGWIIMIKPDPPASLADTREAVERMGPRGETVVEVDHPTRGKYLTVGNPIKLSDSPTEVRRSPLLGEHNDEILRGVLGLSAEEVEAYKAAGALGEATAAAAE